MIFKLEQGEEPWISEGEIQRPFCPGKRGGVRHAGISADSGAPGVGGWAGEHLHIGALVASRLAEEAESSPGLLLCFPSPIGCSCCWQVLEEYVPLCPTLNTIFPYTVILLLDFLLWCPQSPIMISSPFSYSFRH